MTDSKVILGATTAAIAATSVLYSFANSNKKRKQNGITILVFPDGGEQCSKTGGLEPNAITLYDVQSFIKLDFLQNLLAKELEIDMNKAQDIRLWVQVTKEEITDANTKSVLSNKQNGLLSAVVLICTYDRGELSSEAASSEPLGEFSYPSHVRDLSVLGIGHLLAYKRGPHELPIFNAYENLFRGRESKTLIAKRPPFWDSDVANYPEINYHPRKDFGDVLTIDPNLIDDMLSRQSDFPKMWTGKFELKIQEYTGFGLFSNSTPNESWLSGHGVLPRFFNALKIKNYYPLILGKTQSFVREWVAMGNHSKIEDANDWLTCMTADAVCKASMDVDMRNVERKGKGEELHPFLKSFRHCVAYSKGQEQDIARFKEEKKIGSEFIKDLVERTRKGEIGGPLSFITGMLERTANTNGEYVAFDTFEGHCINIMIAGHETTAGTLAFCMAELARNPECMAKVMKEIEDVMGNRSSPTYNDISKLVYIEACFREALRLYAPVQSTKRECAHDTIVNGNRLLRKGQKIEVLFWGLHRNPEDWDQGVFGDVDKFNPDRHLVGAPPRHTNAQKPFGFGVRSCIGMQFALLEAKTFLCMVFNFFNVQTPAGYEIIPHIGKAFTAAPKDLDFDLSFRAGGPLDRINLFGSFSGESTPLTSKLPEAVTEKKSNVKTKNGGSVIIAYGSNAGTCEEFASLLADEVTKDGFDPEMMTLDQVVDKLPNKDSPVLIVSSTYNGAPPDNAVKFNKWMTSLKEGSLNGMSFGVFGVGNSNWESTYQKFPTEIHMSLVAGGATQMKEITKSDCSLASFAEEFDDWLTDIMDVVRIDSGTTQTVKTPIAQRHLSYCKVVDTNSIKGDPVRDVKVAMQILEATLKATLKKGEAPKNPPFRHCEVTKLIQLQSEYSDRSTCHVELSLSSPEMVYEVGDHLLVLCRNNEHMVNSTLEVLNLEGDEVVEMNPGLIALITRNYPVDLTGILVTARLAITWLPDLTASPTRKVLNSLAEQCPCPPEAAALRDLADNKNYKDKVLNVQLTLSEILSMYRSVELDIEKFCACLPRLKPRYYSISSSPLVSPTRVSITVGLVEYETKIGRHHKGAASGMINTLEVGSAVFASVHKLNSKFKLPKDPSTPIIMVGPGTGVAPFMGFLEERNVLAKKQGRKLGPAHLFFGCRSSKTDFIYKDSLESYKHNRVLSADGLHVAFSREDDQSKVYVQDLIEEFSQELWGMIDKGAIIYICGDAKRMSPGVKAAFVNIAMKQGISKTEAESWMGSMMSSNRYLEDVYA